MLGLPTKRFKRVRCHRKNVTKKDRTLGLKVRSFFMLNFTSFDSTSVYAGAVFNRCVHHGGRTAISKSLALVSQKRVF